LAGSTNVPSPCFLSRLSHSVSTQALHPRSTTAPYQLTCNIEVRLIANTCRRCRQPREPREGGTRSEIGVIPTAPFPQTRLSTPDIEHAVCSEPRAASRPETRPGARQRKTVVRMLQVALARRPPCALEPRPVADRMRLNRHVLAGWSCAASLDRQQKTPTHSIAPGAWLRTNQTLRWRPRSRSR